jgi:hypothetical protein
MTNRVSNIYDADLVLRASGSAETSTASETAIAFPVRKIGDYKAVIVYSGLDFTTGDESYVWTVEVSDTSGGTYTAIATTPDMGSATAAGRLDVPLNGKIAEQLDADSAFVRVTATLGGTSPSVDYDCYLTKS